MADSRKEASRNFVHPDGSLYRAVRSAGVIACAQGISRCEVVRFLTPDGRRVGSAHLPPGTMLVDLADEDLVRLLDEARKG